MADKTIVLAFSGGLDTSFCVPYLIERGYRVITLFVDTGGVDAEERRYVETRAKELGASEHVTVDGGREIWTEFVVPLVQFHGAYHDQYPLLCSDRYIIVRKSLELCKRKGTRLFAHGCTGMGNDQVRFDLSVRALGDFDIIAPIREIQSEHKAVRVYEQEYLKKRGFAVRPKTSKYTINENILGVTVSGSEIDEFAAPSDETYQLCPPPARRQREPMRVNISFEKGVPVRIDGERMEGPAMLASLNRRFGEYGVGRYVYSSDTTIGLKARIVFECPGITALMYAHRSLEDAIGTAWQNHFKPIAGKQWTELVYKGFFYEPLKRDLESFLASTQQFVTGTVTLETAGGDLMAVALDSSHILRREGASYAQTADWNMTEAEGFIKLYGQSSTMSARVNPIYSLDAGR